MSDVCDFHFYFFFFASDFVMRKMTGKLMMMMMVRPSRKIYTCECMIRMRRVNWWCPRRREGGHIEYVCMNAARGRRWSRRRRRGWPFITPRSPERERERRIIRYSQHSFSPDRCFTSFNIFLCYSHTIYSSSPFYFTIRIVLHENE